ncbi:MAG: energy transducer TonB [Prevotellaceae bacterium]|nr:energy transducer TonB [Prevotella sp.]MDD7247605.1 energy transducer TonB [Prevotellaceae bacterium]MDY2749213.1 energy transducer TonB [Prevotella sp.]
MEEKKSYKADLEHRRPLVFAIALVAVTALFVGILFIPFKSLSDIGEELFDDYSMDLELKANDQDDMISAALPQPEVEKKEADQLNKVDDTPEMAPEQLEQPPRQADDEEAKEEEKTDEEPPINLNGDDEEVLRIVEQLPEYPGGMVEFVKWLTATLKYPDDALRRRMQGKVMISFIVEKDGTLTGLKVIKSAGKIFDDEALRVARLMPQWKPGKADGKPCRSMIAIPIVFEM